MTQPISELFPQQKNQHEREAVGNHSQKEKRNKLVFTPRMKNILYALSQADYLSLPQLEGLFWRARRGGKEGTLRAAQRELKRLRDEGVIRVVAQWMRRGEGTQPYIYALTKKGADFVNREFEIERSTIRWKINSAEDDYRFLAHLLSTNDLWVAVARSAEKHGVQLEQWIHERQLRSRDEREYVELIEDPEMTNSKVERVAVIFDSFFVLKDRRGRGYFPVEIDRSTLTVFSQRSKRTWHTKMKAFKAYYESGAYERRYGTRTFLYLTVTTSLKRLMHLKETTEAVVPNSDQFWFTTFEHIVSKQPIKSFIPKGSSKQKTVYKTVYNEDLLTQPIWYRTGDNALHGLLE